MTLDYVSPTTGMQRMEIMDYVNEKPRPRQKHIRATNWTDRRIVQLLLGFGVLCIVQVTLNIVLRLTLYSSKESTHWACNTTQQQRINALTTNLTLQEKRNAELNNMIKTLEEREKLKVQLRELSGCVSSQRCPAGWREINSRCYFLSSESKTWEESRKYCQSKDADLVVINSRQEQAALYCLNGEDVVLFWIGLYNMDGTFRWVDGSTLTETFWQAGQPNLGDPTNREDCVEMYRLELQFTNWNNVPCEKVQRWLCERETLPVLYK